MRAMALVRSQKGCQHASGVKTLACIIAELYSCLGGLKDLDTGIWQQFAALLIIHGAARHNLAGVKTDNSPD